MPRAVMTARQAGYRVHMRVGQLLRPRSGVELPADVGKLLARVRVEMDLAVAEEVLLGWVLLFKCVN